MERNETRARDLVSVEDLPTEEIRRLVNLAADLNGDEEITDGAIDGLQSVVLGQVENMMHPQKGIPLTLMAD